MFAYTNAPQGYDYWYVETIQTVQDKNGKDWRLLKVKDDLRFKSHQIPRYESGLKQAYMAEDQDDIDYLKLPPLPAPEVGV